MGGRWIVEPVGYHKCLLPDINDRNTTGGIFRCDCGQFWRNGSMWWHRVGRWESLKWRWKARHTRSAKTELTEPSA